MIGKRQQVAAANEAKVSWKFPRSFRLSLLFKPSTTLKSFLDVNAYVIKANVGLVSDVRSFLNCWAVPIAGDEKSFSLLMKNRPREEGRKTLVPDARRGWLVNNLEALMFILGKHVDLSSNFRCVLLLLPESRFLPC